MEIGDWRLAEIVATVIESLGVVVIGLGVVVAFYVTLRSWLADRTSNSFVTFRRAMTRWLLLGLELLIAADIISTVTLELDVASVASLGILVLIRTFLVWSIVVEDEGRWPWQRAGSIERAQREAHPEA